MTEVTVEKLAKIVGTPAEKMLMQMKEAGLKQSSPLDSVTDRDKKILLVFLKDQQRKSSKTITLKKKPSLEEFNKGTTIEIRRKNIKSQKIENEIPEDSKRIDFDEIEKKRIAGEENKKSEEERQRKEAQKKIFVKRKTKRDTEPPVIKRTKQGPINLKVADRKKPIKKENIILKTHQKLLKK